MWRGLAFLFVPLLALFALAGVVLGIWALFDGSYKGAGGLFFWAAVWAWGAISTYKREIKEPREEKKKLHAAITGQLADVLEPGVALSQAIQKVRDKFSVVGSPRYRTSIDSQFDTAVELETKSFTIWLLGKDEVLKTWEVT